MMKKKMISKINILQARWEKFVVVDKLMRLVLMSLHKAVVKLLMLR